MKHYAYKFLFAAMLTMGANASSNVVQEADADYAKIVDPASRCTLVNNVWDRKSAPAGFSQNIFLEKRADKTLPGWRWTAPGERAIVLSMPELVCGDKPWDAPQKRHAMFPRPVLGKHLTAAFDIEAQASGRYNMAFSFWAVTRPNATKADITHEIMIWTVNSGMTPEGQKIGELATGGMEFDIYLKPDQGVITGPDPFTWKLVSFVARRPLLQGSLDFDVFIDDLIRRQILKHDQFLTSLELGDEVASGTGRSVVKELTIGEVPPGN